MTEIINAALKTGTEYFVAPYFSTPQIVSFYRAKLVHACVGSVQSLLYQSNIQQIITNFSIEGGTFQFVDKKDMLDKFEGNHDLAGDLFILRGSMYGFHHTDTPLKTLIEHKKKATDFLNSPDEIQSFMFIKPIF